jgi:hypothetical protein
MDRAGCHNRMCFGLQNKKVLKVVQTLPAVHAQLGQRLQLHQLPLGVAAQDVSAYTQSDMRQALNKQGAVVSRVGTRRLSRASYGFNLCSAPTARRHSVVLVGGKMRCMRMNALRFPRAPGPADA